MKSIAVFVVAMVFMCSIHSSECLKGPREDATDFLEGFFSGALHDEAIDINECIDDGNQIINMLEQIVVDFEKGLGDLENLILHIIDLLSEIPKSVLTCKKVPADIHKLEDWTMMCADRNIMGKRFFNLFLEYGDRVKEDVKNLIENFKSKGYKISGNSLGDLLFLLFEKVQPTFTVKEALNKLEKA